MPKMSYSRAAEACHVDKSTISRWVASGRYNGGFMEGTTHGEKFIDLPDPLPGAVHRKIASATQRNATYDNVLTLPGEVLLADAAVPDEVRRLVAALREDLFAAREALRSRDAEARRKDRLLSRALSVTDAERRHALRMRALDVLAAGPLDEGRQRILERLVDGAQPDA